MAEPSHDPAASFVAKWEAREPTLRLLPSFLPPALQRRVPLWLSLLNEFDEAMFETSDPAVSRTKLAWWGEELASGSARHPLARALREASGEVMPDGPRWRVLVSAAIGLSQHEDSPADWQQLAARWQAFAQVAAEIESQLCGASSSADLLARQWWMQRCLRALLRNEPTRVGLPLNVRTRLPEGRFEALAGGGGDEAWRLFADALQAAPSAPGALHRHLQHRIDRHRLDALIRGKALAQVHPITPWRGLWFAWSAARAAQR